MNSARPGRPRDTRAKWPAGPSGRQARRGRIPFCTLLNYRRPCGTRPRDPPATATRAGGRARRIRHDAPGIRLSIRQAALVASVKQTGRPPVWQRENARPPKGLPPATSGRPEVTGRHLGASAGQQVGARAHKGRARLACDLWAAAAGWRPRLARRPRARRPVGRNSLRPRALQLAPPGAG